METFAQTNFKLGVTNTHVENMRKRLQKKMGQPNWPVKNIRKRVSIFSLQCSNEEDMLNLNGIFTSNSLNGSDKLDMQNHKGILTLTSLNGLLGSD